MLREQFLQEYCLIYDIRHCQLSSTSANSCMKTYFEFHVDFFTFISQFLLKFSFLLKFGKKEELFIDPGVRGIFSSKRFGICAALHCMLCFS